MDATYINCKSPIMKFRLGNNSIMLRGDPLLGRTLVSLKKMGKTIKQEGHGVLVELGILTTMATNNLHDPEALATLLADSERVFNIPKGLLPARGKEHKIVLKEGSGQVNVRPYRYPH